MSDNRKVDVRAVTAARTSLLLGLLLLGACGGKDSPAEAPAEPRGPTLSWEAVPGATDYGVFVFEPPAKAPVWIWEGASTTVQYGQNALAPMPDLPAPPAQRTPARVSARPLSDGAEYGVVAFDASGGIAGVHDRRKVQ